MTVPWMAFLLSYSAVSSAAFVCLVTVSGYPSWCSLVMVVLNAVLVGLSRPLFRRGK